MKCEFKAGCVVGARMQITDKISVDLSHVDRRSHESSGNRSFLGRHKCDVGRQLEISTLKTIRVTAAQIEPSIFPSDFEALYCLTCSSCPSKLNFCWHDLRHTFGTRLRRNGTPLEDIAALMGHDLG